MESSDGAPLIWNAFTNMGSSFPTSVRDQYRLQGLLPPQSEDLKTQADRVVNQLKLCSDDLQKYIMLHEVAATSQVLYYKVLTENVRQLLPIVYTPTVGKGCQQYDRIYSHPLGIYLSAFDHKGRFLEVLSNWPSKSAQLIVITDGGRILGLGDLGINGMGISVGKVSLYCATAGFHPECSIPICLDVGTNNEDLKKDPFYLGSKKPRMEGSDLLQIVEEFCNAVKSKFPSCLIQFEDFETTIASKILNQERERTLCFNDDIQGTGTVVLAGFMNGVRLQNLELKDVRVVFYGAGSSAVGVADMIINLMVKEGGLSSEEAHKAIFMVDSKGLITKHRGDELPEHKRPFAQPEGIPNMKELTEIIKYVKPQVLIGLSGHGPAFFEQDIKELCEHCEKPLVFPLSNPTDNSEISAADAISFSNGRCVFAAGSPFDPVEHNGKKITPSQANNVFVFPGIGFGASVVHAKKVSDGMLMAAAKALAKYVSREQFDRGQVYPDIEEIRSVSCKVATAVAQAALDEGLVTKKFSGQKDLETYIKECMWSPDEAVRKYDQEPAKRPDMISRLQKMAVP